MRARLNQRFIRVVTFGSHTRITGMHKKPKDIEKHRALCKACPRRGDCYRGICQVCYEYINCETKECKCNTKDTNK